MILSFLIGMAVSRGQAQIPAQAMVFGRGLDTALYYATINGGSPVEWHSLGGQIASAPDACSLGADRVDVFVRGRDDRLWQISPMDSKWSRWIQLDGDLASGPTAVCSPNRIDVFAVAADKRVIHKIWNGTAWSRWESLDGLFADGTTADAVSNGPNQSTCS